MKTIESWEGYNWRVEIVKFDNEYFVHIFKKTGFLRYKRVERAYDHRYKFDDLRRARQSFFKVIHRLKKEIDDHVVIF